MKTLALGTLMLATMMFGETYAAAKTTAGVSSAPAVPTRSEQKLADSVVVTPQGTTAPQPATAVQPVAAAPVAQAPAQPVVAEPSSHKVVHADVQPNHNYMSTIAMSALMGGVAGGLIGGAIYYLGDRNDAINIAYWAAGGVLVGTGVGVVQLAVQESRVSEATALRKLPTDPAPTFRLALFKTRF